MIRVNRKKYDISDSINSISPSSVKVSYRAHFDLHIWYIKFFGCLSARLWLSSS
jgi:hypothetical protein